MLIHGLQKMTLLDFPGKVACTVFLGGCDFRCPFCHNAEIICGEAKPLMDDTEFLAFLGKRRGLLDGVCITGGEPLLRDETAIFMRAIRDMGFMVKLDTNGSHPARLASILEEGLADYVAMDIKNTPERYAETAGAPNLDLGAIRESVALLMDGKTAYEFRTTVVKEFHDEASFHGIARWIAGAKRYFLQSFVDRETVKFGNLHAPSTEDLKRYLAITRGTIPGAAIRGEA